MNKKQYITKCKNDFIFCAKNQYKIRSLNEKTGKFGLVPFALNPEQIDLLNTIQHQLDTLGYVRIIILKSRKLGFSTLIQALAVHHCQWTPHSEALTIAHHRSATEYIFGIGKRIVENMHAEVGPSLGEKVKGNRIAWANGSTFQCRTQGGSVDKERGATPTFLHLSEVPSWGTGRVKSSVADIAQALLNSVPDVPGTFVFLESTARGAGNYFHEQWLNSVSGDTYFAPKFYSWADRRQEFNVEAPTKKQQQIEKRLHAQFVEAIDDGDRVAAREISTQLNYTPLEYDRACEFRLTPSKVRFWRNTLANKCNGDQDRFDEEFPLTPEQAFIMSGRPVFLTGKINERKKAIADLKPVKRYCTLDLIDDVPTFVSDGGGIGGGWTVIEKPKRTHQYIISGDAASGGKSKEEDYSAIVVLDRATCRIVATYRSKVYPDFLAGQMALASRIYNNGLLVPERNSFGLVTINELVSSFPEQPIFRRFSEVGKINFDERNLLGYDTNQRTRNYAINAFSVLWRRGEIEIFDHRLLNEMLHFVRGSSGKPEAASGKNDDLVMATAIACDIYQLQSERGIPAIQEDKPTVDFSRMAGVSEVFDRKCPKLEEEEVPWWA